MAGYAPRETIDPVIMLADFYAGEFPKKDRYIEKFYARQKNRDHRELVIGGLLHDDVYLLGLPFSDVVRTEENGDGISPLELLYDPVPPDRAWWQVVFVEPDFFATFL